MKNPEAKAPRRGRRRWSRRLAWAAVALVAAIVGANVHVLVAGERFVFPAAAVAPADCLVVPGARIHADGTPFPMLGDRLEAAFDLFARGKAPRIVLSGRGGGGIAVDEVAAMRRWLLARGVAAEVLLDDPAGLRTLDTMQRCRTEFGMRSAIVVSNGFHVARAVFLGRHGGLDARGVAAPQLADYSTGTLWRNRGREVLARVRAWLDVFVFGAA
ncbi:MAG: YdcF family protein [Planctomycetes bacterium]|nr:YdcF family protein [Planctomycetota bacterium]